MHTQITIILYIRFISCCLHSFSFFNHLFLFLSKSKEFEQAYYRRLKYQQKITIVFMPTILIKEAVQT